VRTVLSTEPLFIDNAVNLIVVRLFPMP
jgi:hypothetical protein